MYLAIVPFQSTCFHHFPYDLMVKSGMPRQQGWHGGPERHRNRNLHSNLASSWRHSHFERLFWSFQQLGIGDFRIFLSSKSGISWNFSIKTWDFLGFYRQPSWISWDFDGTWMGIIHCWSHFCRFCHHRDNFLGDDRIIFPHNPYHCGHIPTSEVRERIGPPL